MERYKLVSCLASGFERLRFGSCGGVQVLRGLVRARNGSTALIAVDGPRGPDQVPKKGHST